MIPIIDMHCDTIYAIYKQRRKGREAVLRNNDLSVDLVRMREGGYIGQCFAMFTYLPEIRGAGRMQMLADALSLAGFTEGEIEKIFWRNVMRVYKDVLR